MSVDTARWQRRLRTPGAVNIAASLILILVVLLIAVPARIQGPPSIAEYAPQPQQPIKQAPQEQSATLGKAQGGTGSGPSGSGPGQGTGPGPGPLPSGVVYRQCVGSPPRQIEDPQSPPCVPYWKGDNGGATSKGVTRTQITVSMESRTYIAGYTDDLIKFFNQRFEFYGRQLVLKQYTSAQSDCSNNATACGSTSVMSADAAGIDQSISPFADLGYVPGGSGDGSEYYFYDQLAQRGIMSVEVASRGGATFVDESHLDQYAPYEWNYLPALDDDLNSMAGFMCAQLVGKPPSFAGAPTNTAPQRKFGLMVENYPTALQPNLQPLLQNPCSEPIPVVTFQNTQQDQVNAMLQLKAAGVTSIFCVCRAFVLAESLFPAASGQSYYPEWLVTNYGVQDDDFIMAFWAEGSSPNQTQHMLGLSGFNKWVPGADMPVNWAAEDINPADNCPSGCYNWEFWAQYWNLLLLASGIQEAGPNLTPANFQAGLYRTTFPNPGCGGPPYYQGCVGFGPHDHTMIQDYAMVWWSDSATEPYYFEGETAPGAYCYIGFGKRFRDSWPTTPQPFFDPRAPCQ